METETGTAPELGTAGLSDVPGAALNADSGAADETGSMYAAAVGESVYSWRKARGSRSLGPLKTHGYEEKHEEL